ncbi:MAG: nucleotidyltransferase family protein [Rubrivivax sp.]|nr:nucleotidyltransferase family protein [Rubrivivax sp.]
MADRDDLVIEALTRDAGHFRRWQAPHWSRLLQQARGTGLLGRVGERLRRLWQAEDIAPLWPEALAAHVASANRVIAAQRAEVQRELELVARALEDLGAPVIALKGAAYLAAALPPAQARVFSDVDILVPKHALAEAESRLMLHGWLGSHHNAYDQRYYREWMHELPPMQHARRGTTLDVHHNILPETARLKPQGHLLVCAAVPAPAHPGWHVLSPPDMVLHSMTHLFMNEETSHALRDLSDLDLLLRHFGTEDSFWATLLERAGALDLRRPLFYGLTQTARVLGTPVPPHVAARARAGGPALPLRPIMQGLWRRVLRSAHPSAQLPGATAARFALYVRGHWLRMPPGLLARHLTIKALRLHQRQPGGQASPPTNG